MKNTSIWLDNIDYKEQKSINKDLETDVLIIGGGITGLSIAYRLINKDLKITLVEKNIIGNGITGRTTGKLTFLQELVYSNLENTYNKDIAKLYLESQIDAIKTVEDIVNKNNIDCDFKKVKSFVYTNKDKDVMGIKKEKGLLEEFGIEVTEINTLPDKTTVEYGICVDNTAVFHPIKYLVSLKSICIQEQINIFEHTNVTSIKKENESYICKANNFNIKAKYVVLANFYPNHLISFLMPLKTHLEKSYVTAFKVSKNLYFSAITSKGPTFSMRYLSQDKDVYKIHLSNSHNIAFKNDDENNFKELIKDSNDSPEYLWSNVDIITSDKLPFIGLIDKNLYLATGYNTWGMTNGTIAGKIISDLITTGISKYQSIFNPKRGISKNTFISFPVNITSNIKSFVGTKLNKNKSWYKENVIFEKGLATYIDEKNVKHTVYNKCPHLGCSLIFNEIEKTWDCPCHGSRFDIDGKPIFGPSNYDISYKED